jgi:deoxyribonuclease V
VTWPETAAALRSEQDRLASLDELPTSAAHALIGGCFVCFASGPKAERAFAAAALLRGHKLLDVQMSRSTVDAPYEPGLLALRVGPVLEAAVRSLSRGPEVLLVNATGRDHPRRAGLALHLGSVLGIPTVGITDRPLIATASEPGPRRGDRSPLVAGGEIVGFFLRSRAGVRPIVVHAAWCTTPESAVAIVAHALLRARTPQPLRIARREARLARARRIAVSP